MKIRKLLSVLLAAVMCLTMFTAVVTWADEAPALDGSWPAQTVKIGIVNKDTTTAQYAYSARYCAYLEDHFNIQFIQSEAVDTVEQEMAFIESCAAAGCTGIIGWRNVGGAAIIKLCESKGLYYWISGADDVILSRYGSNAALLGYLEAGTEVDYSKGYGWGKALADAGCHKVVYMSGGADYGVQIFVDRRNGFYDAIADAQAEGKDIEVIYEINTWPDSDAYSAMQDTALAMDPDGIADSVGTEYWIQPLNTSGKLDGSLKLATNIDLTEDSLALYEMDVIAGGISDDATLTYVAPGIPLIINAANGHTELTKLEDGTAISCPTPFWKIESADDFAAIFSYVDEGNFFLTAEDMAQLFPEFNADASIELYQDTFRSRDMDKALEIASGN